MGFIWPVKRCSLSFDSFNEAKIMTHRGEDQVYDRKADLSELESIARSRTGLWAGSSARGAAGPTGKTHLSMRWGKPWACIIRRSNATLSEPKAEGALAALDERARPGKERRSTVEAKTWWWRWPAGRRRSWVSA